MLTKLLEKLDAHIASVVGLFIMVLYFTTVVNAFGNNIDTTTDIQLTTTVPAQTQTPKPTPDAETKTTISNSYSTEEIQGQNAEPNTEKTNFDEPIINEPEPTTSTQEPEIEKMQYTAPSNPEIDILAKTTWGEARGCPPDEQKLVIWTIFQRVDIKTGEFRNYNTIPDVATKPYAFHGYDPNNPIDPEIYELCRIEYERWQKGETPPIHSLYAPSIPYYFFEGDGKHNYYRAEW